MEAEEARLPLGQAATLDEVGELVADPFDAVVDLLLREVAQHDGDLQASEEEERELTGHEPGADQAHLLYPPRLRVGHSDPTLRAALDEVEGVHGRLRLGAWEELGQRVLLRSVPSSSDHDAAPSMRSSARYGAGCRAVHLAVEPRAGLPADLGGIGKISRGRRLPAPSSTFSSRNASESSRNSTGSKSASA
jgi:hypothetical protein